MKKWFLFIATILSLCSNVARANDLVDGIGAYSKDNYAQALKLLRPLATTQGNADAQYYLGLMYVYGKGVTQNHGKAVKLYRLAAGQGHESAQITLGLMYVYGGDVTRDYQEAVKFLRLAAAQGNADAQYQLGWMYEGGEGVIQDYVRAYMWFNLSVSKRGQEAKENRDRIAKKMKPSQIADAQRMARVCEKKNYKNCE